MKSNSSKQNNRLSHSGILSFLSNRKRKADGKFTKSQTRSNQAQLTKCFIWDCWVSKVCIGFLETCWWIHFPGVSRELVDVAAIKISMNILRLFFFFGQDSWPIFSCVLQNATASRRGVELKDAPEISSYPK